jgi:hypothetical protein
MLSAAKHPRALSFRPPGVDASAARILPLTVVDNSDFPPPRLTDPSDSPYDQETVPATPFKQRGFVWPFMCCCSCSCSSSSLWHFFGILADSIFRLPPQEQGPSIPPSNVSSSPAPQTTAPPVDLPPLPRRVEGQHLLMYAPGTRSKAGGELPNACRPRALPVPISSARTLGSLTLPSMRL